MQSVFACQTPMEVDSDWGVLTIDLHAWRWKAAAKSQLTNKVSMSMKRTYDSDMCICMRYSRIVYIYILCRRLICSLNMHYIFRSQTAIVRPQSQELPLLRPHCATAIWAHLCPYNGSYVDILDIHIYIYTHVCVCAMKINYMHVYVYISIVFI